VFLSLKYFHSQKNTQFSNSKYFHSQKNTQFSNSCRLNFYHLRCQEIAYWHFYIKKFRTPSVTSPLPKFLDTPLADEQSAQFSRFKTSFLMKVINILLFKLGECVHLVFRIVSTIVESGLCQPLPNLNRHDASFTCSHAPKSQNPRHFSATNVKAATHYSRFRSVCAENHCSQVTRRKIIKVFALSGAESAGVYGGLNTTDHHSDPW
jgi:hypothetical protein